MDRAGDVAAVLRCPVCQAAVRPLGRGFSCIGRSQHRFPGRGGYVTFAKPDPGKYQRERAQRYAAIQAFGYQTQHFGGQETVYRTVSSLVAECVASAPAAERPVIVDCGCGVGRVAADCAVLAVGGFVIAIDASRDMLDMASRVVLGRRSIVVPSAEFPPDRQYKPEQHGFRKLIIPGRRATNVLLGRADAENVPVKTGAADIALSIMVVDRLPHGPEKAISECFRILRPGGHFILVDPFNWTASKWWQRYPDAESIVRFVRKSGFKVATWFDGLPYREVRDGRGYVHEFRVTAIHGVKQLRRRNARPTLNAEP